MPIPNYLKIYVFTIFTLYSFFYLQMLVKWFILCLVAMPVTLTNGNERKCPAECICNMDESKRFQTVCTKGKLHINKYSKKKELKHKK